LIYRVAAWRRSATTRLPATSRLPIPNPDLAVLTAGDYTVMWIAESCELNVPNLTRAAGTSLGEVRPTLGRLGKTVSGSAKLGSIQHLRRNSH
jgi:hypothetical protein